MAVILSNRRISATRKPWACECCGRVFRAGGARWSYAAINDRNEFQASSFCESCEAIFIYIQESEEPEGEISLDYAAEVAMRRFPAENLIQSMNACDRFLAAGGEL